MRILLIEDDSRISDFVVKGFKETGHTIDAVTDGKEGLFMASSEKYDLVITDRMLPGMDGLQIISELRAQSNTVPVLALSAKGEVQDRVEGLRVGADDYLAKPFAFSELLARAEALERRNVIGGEREKVTTLQAADLRMDLLARKVYRGDTEISLQAREFKLLEYLLRHKGQAVTRTMLLESLWDYHFDPQTNVIDVHISRLRGKVDKGFTPRLIKTLRGSGYMLDESEAESYFA